MKSMKQAKKDIRAAVERGAALLDKRQPRWFERIDLDALRLQDGSYCICGQLDAVRRGFMADSGEGSWDAQVHRLFGRRVNMVKSNSRDETHGFSISYENDCAFEWPHSGWEYAEGIWKTEIVKRRRAARRAAA